MCRELIKINNDSFKTSILLSKTCTFKNEPQNLTEVDAFFSRIILFYAIEVPDCYKSFDLFIVYVISMFLLMTKRLA